MKIWLRKEDKKNEQRSPLSPSDAQKLISLGHHVVVESSTGRIFPDQEYSEAGCEITEESWSSAPLDFIILGLKELEVNEQTSFRHQHIYFAHAYKGQELAQVTLESFKRGQGQLFDLEYLTDSEGKRIAAFGVWAGFVGAALAIDHYYHGQVSPDEYPALTSFSRQQHLIDKILENKKQSSLHPKIIIIGAKGRCGFGAQEAVRLCGLESTNWDYHETKSGGPFQEINEHNIFVNCALINKKIPPFVTNESLTDNNKKLTTIADVGCDPNSDLNPLPIYSESTLWPKPFSHLKDLNINLLSIDNLPSVLPYESSIDFSSQLIPHLIDLGKSDGENLPTVWENSLKVFKEKIISNV